MRYMEIMRAIALNAGITLFEIAERLGMSNPSAGHSLDELERMGLIRRDVRTSLKTDRRKKPLRLTRAGEVAWEELMRFRLDALFDWKREAERHPAMCDLTIRHCACLLALHRDEVLRSGQIALEVGFSTAAATGLVDTFEKAGIAQRNADARDGRVVLVTLTPKGRALAAELARIL